MAKGKARRKRERRGGRLDQMRMKWAANQKKDEHIFKFGTSSELEKRLEKRGLSPLYRDVMRIAKDTGSPQMFAAIRELENLGLDGVNWRHELKKKSDNADARRKHVLRCAAKHYVMMGHSETEAADLIAGEVGTRNSLEAASHEIRVLLQGSNDDLLNSFKKVPLAARRKIMPTAEKMIARALPELERIVREGTEQGRTEAEINEILAGSHDPVVAISRVRSIERKQ